MLQKLSGFTRNIWITVALVLLLAAVFAQYTLLERQVDSSNDLRLQSLLLADELRQSSDDLTRMARTYVVTGEPRYKQYSSVIPSLRYVEQAAQHRRGILGSQAINSIVFSLNSFAKCPVDFFDYVHVLTRQGPCLVFCSLGTRCS